MIEIRRNVIKQNGSEWKTEGVQNCNVTLMIEMSHNMKVDVEL